MLFSKFSPRGAVVPCLTLICALTVFVVPALGSEALKNYIERPEPAEAWEVIASTPRPEHGVTINDVLLTSQTWTGIVWKHHLSVIVPDDLKGTGHALLFITGGGVKDGMPKIGDPAKDDELQSIGQIAKHTGSIVAILRQVPNQPLYGGKVEDELISYTYDKYLSTKDEEWPLLLPMTKSAVKAMDAVQALAKKEPGAEVEKFVVSGGSKRGWTTWLTGAVDDRVAAIAPIVIDTLNFDKQMPYQLKVWGKYSDQIADYTKLGIQERMDTPDGKALNAIVDPYSYIDGMTMPKLLLIGTNDPYWPVDAVKHYFDDLKGESNYIHYVPNGGHGLEGGTDQAIGALGAFFALQANGKKHPSIAFDTEVENGRFIVKGTGDSSAVDVTLWSATSKDRDFRDDKWKESEVYDKDYGHCTIRAKLPEEGYKALYAKVLFPNPLGGTYSKCSRVFVLDKDGFVAD